MSLTLDDTNGVTFPSGTTSNGILGNTTQVWTNVTSSRTSGTTYTNSTSAPIMVIFYGYDNSGQALSLSITVNGAAASPTGMGGPTGYPIPHPFIVPSGQTYSMSWNTSANTSGIWELR